MRIPDGQNLGNRLQDATQTAIQGGGDAVAQAWGQLAGQVGGIASDMAAEKAREREALARVKAAGLVQDRELQYETILVDLESRAKRGELTARGVEDAYTLATKSLERPDMSGLAPELSAHVDNSFQAADQRYRLSLFKVLDQAETSQARLSMDGLLDGLSKRAALSPDPAGVVSAFDAEDIQVAARRAYGDRANSVLQSARDGIWQAAAKRQLSDAGSPEQVQQFLGDLGGRYQGKLGADHAVALYGAAQNKLEQFQRREQLDQKKHLADAGKALDEYRQQIASTTPAPPEQYLQWAQRIRGTEYEGEIAALQQQEAAIQQVLKLPPEEQDRFLTEARGQMQTAGATRDQMQNFNALETAVTANRKLLADEPLRWVAERTGARFEPLANTIQSGDLGAAGVEIQKRLNTLRGLQQQMGRARVNLKVLQPDEADVLGSALKQALPAQQGVMLGTLNDAIKDKQAYVDTIQQVAKDDAALTFAGIAWARNMRTTQDRRVAELVLEGRQVLADKSVTLPPDAAATGGLLTSFNEMLGDSVEPGSKARQALYESYRAVYAKLAKDKGNPDKLFDDDIAKQAVKLTAGHVADYNDHKTILPWGMEEDEFMDKLDVSLRAAETEHGYPANAFSSMWLRAVGSNRYEIINGSTRQMGRDGLPLVITLGGSQ